MALDIKMPQLSDTMHSGKILSWLKKEGDAIERGDILAEVETDKANLQIESFQHGTLLKIVIPANSTANVGEVIAVMGAAGEQVGASSPKPAAASIINAEATNTGTGLPAPAQKKPNEIPPALQVVAGHATDERVKASPLARKIAEQRNINLSTVQGSGPNGRIIKKDVETTSASSSGSAVQALAGKASPTAAALKSSTPLGTGSLTPLTRMRETIARRMQESVTTAPHFYVTASIDMRQAMKLRELLKEKAEYKGISINHLVIKAVAYALKNERRVNRAMKDGQLFDPAGINVGIITAVDDGLLIPVIKDTDSLPLKDLVFEARAAVERARAGRPNSSDLSGGTFSISNMGMFDVENFTAIINPGQGGILAVSSIREEPIVENGQVVVGKQMKATISVDHRIIDGVMAGNFLKFFKEALEVSGLLMS